MAADGEVSESWGRILCEWIDKLPADRRDDAARIVVDASRAGLGLADLLALTAEMFVRSLPPTSAATAKTRTMGRMPPVTRRRTAACAWRPPSAAPGS